MHPMLTLRFALRTFAIRALIKSEMGRPVGPVHRRRRDPWDLGRRVKTMKRLGIGLIALVLLSGVGIAGYRQYSALRTHAGSGYHTAAIRRGDVKVVVNSTGTVQPVLSVQVGAFVSGPVEKVNVDFNARVKKDQVLAEIDPRTYQAAVAHARAALAHSQADVTRTQALLEQAFRNEQRGLLLRKLNKGAISDTDLDQAVTDRRSLEAQLELARAMVVECQADLDVAKTNLEFTVIKSPVDGVVIDRKIDPGQTVASQFQTPVLFVVAPDLEKKIYVYASVDEADIGLIRDAQRNNQPVTFAVDAYPNDAFEGRIAQVRLNPTTVQNVVTYTVVVESPNHELKLLPGMTANLTFQIENRHGVLVVPNGALRFWPKAEQVRAEDQSLVESEPADDSSDEEAAPKKSKAAWRRDGQSQPPLCLDRGRRAVGRRGDRHRIERQVRR